MRAAFSSSDAPTLAGGRSCADAAAGGMLQNHMLARRQLRVPIQGELNPKPRRGINRIPRTAYLEVQPGIADGS